MGLVYSPLLLQMVTLHTFVSSEGWTCSKTAIFQLPLGWWASISITKSPSTNWCCSSCHLLVFLSSCNVFLRNNDQNWSKSSQTLCHLWEWEVILSVVTLPPRFPNKNWLGVRMRSPSESESLLSGLLLTKLATRLAKVQNSSTLKSEVWQRLCNTLLAMPTIRS